MDFIFNYIDFLIHFDRHLGGILQQYGTYTYAILFLIIFCETGLVVTPFLPGDSLLFVVGTFAAREDLDRNTLLMLLPLAAIVGDNVNYWVGHFFGPRMAEKKKSRWIRQEYLDRTRHFYEKYGGKTVFLGKFLPIIRTFAPFVAGIGSMTYPRFLFFNVSGGILWVLLFVLAGFWFGNIPVIQKNFSLVIIALVLIPGIPATVEFIRMQLARRRAKKAVPAGQN